MATTPVAMRSGERHRLPNAAADVAAADHDAPTDSDESTSGSSACSASDARASGSSAHSADADDDKAAAETGPPDDDPQAHAVNDEAQLPLWMRVANARMIADVSPPLRDIGVDSRLLTALGELGVKTAFPVQAALVPRLLKDAALVGGGGDICCCAPTGSGKTLAYALPILQHLLPRVIRRLRALVVVPTRALAEQVHRVFSALCEDLDLEVGMAVGQDGSSWDEERISLLGATAPLVDRGSSSAQTDDGGRSLVDVLIATPGRLVEHISARGGFTLQHLRWLVIDEADRLLARGGDSWLPLLLEAAHVSGDAAAAAAGSAATASTRVEPLHSGAWDARTNLGWRAAQTTRRPAPGSEMAALRGGVVCPARARAPLTKLLFSATLRRSATQLAPLRLHRPSYFCVAGARYAVPATLTEWALRCAESDKPIVLSALLRRLSRPDAPEYWRVDAATAAPHESGCVLIFCNSVDATHRLARLLQVLGHRVAEYSSALSARRRAAILESLRRSELRIVVASDAMARGIDVDTVDVVISYDSPSNIRGHLHRVGRTARAGRSGTAYTLLTPSDAGDFKHAIASAGGRLPAPLRLPRTRHALQELQPEYERALERLRDVLELERTRQLGKMAPLPIDEPPGEAEKAELPHVSRKRGRGADGLSGDQSI